MSVGSSSQTFRISVVIKLKDGERFVNPEMAAHCSNCEPPLCSERVPHLRGSRSWTFLLACRQGMLCWIVEQAFLLLYWGISAGTNPSVPRLKRQLRHQALVDHSDSVLASQLPELRSFQHGQIPLGRA